MGGWVDENFDIFFTFASTTSAIYMAISNQDNSVQIDYLWTYSPTLGGYMNG